jgi:hypothetical protein
MMDKLIATLLMGTNWLSFFVFKEALFKENEVCLKRKNILKILNLGFKDVRNSKIKWVAHLSNFALKFCVCTLINIMHYNISWFIQLKISTKNYSF